MLVLERRTRGLGLLHRAVDLKKKKKKEGKHNLKIENYVLFGRQSEDLGPDHSLSHHSAEVLSRG